MNRNTLITVFASLVLAAYASAAVAAGASPILVKTVGEKEQLSVVDGKTTTTLVAADKIVPGDTVLYTVTVENQGKQPAQNVAVNNPIAEHMVYVEGSAYAPGMDISFSTDGGKTWADAAHVSIKGQDGASHEAIAADYTHLRFALKGPLAPGAVAIARYKAKLQ
jgi:uncharacterized repeat protein (TIGR01451 family)